MVVPHPHPHECFALELGADDLALVRVLTGAVGLGDLREAVFGGDDAPALVVLELLVLGSVADAIDDDRGGTLTAGLSDLTKSVFGGGDALAVLECLFLG